MNLKLKTVFIYLKILSQLIIHRSYGSIIYIYRVAQEKTYTHIFIRLAKLLTLITLVLCGDTWHIIGYDTAKFYDISPISSNTIEFWSWRFNFHTFLKYSGKWLKVILGTLICFATKPEEVVMRRRLSPF